MSFIPPEEVCEQEQIHQADGNNNNNNNNNNNSDDETQNNVPPEQQQVLDNNNRDITTQQEVVVETDHQQNAPEQPGTEPQEALAPVVVVIGEQQPNENNNNNNNNTAAAETTTNISSENLPVPVAEPLTEHQQVQHQLQQVQEQLRLVQQQLKEVQEKQEIHQNTINTAAAANADPNKTNFISTAVTSVGGAVGGAVTTVGGAVSTVGVAAFNVIKNPFKTVASLLDPGTEDLTTDDDPLYHGHDDAGDRGPSDSVAQISGNQAVVCAPVNLRGFVSTDGTEMAHKRPAVKPPSTGFWKFVDDIVIHEKYDRYINLFYYGEKFVDEIETQQQKISGKIRETFKGKTDESAAASAPGEKPADAVAKAAEEPEAESNETVKGLIAEFVPLAFRASVTQTLTFVNQTVCVMMVSHELGTDELAPFGVALAFFNICSSSLMMSISVAMETLASQAYGHNRHGPEVGQHVQFNLSIIYVVNIPLSLFFLFCEPVMALIFGPELAVGMAAFLKSGPFYIYMTSTRTIMTRAFMAEKRGGIALRGMLITVLIFPIMAYYIIPLGITWAGMALGLAALVHILAMLFIAYFFDRSSWIHRVSWRPWDIVKLYTWERVKVLFGIATPNAVGVVLSWFNGWIQESVIWIGAQMAVDQVAALSIILNLAMLMSVEMLGFAMASASVIGSRIGANEARNARATARVCIFFGVILCIVNCILVLVFGRNIFSFYTDYPDVLDDLSTVLPVIAFFHFCEGTQLSIGGVFQAAGEQRQTVRPLFWSMWGVAIPAMYVSVVMYHKNIPGLLLCFAIGFLLQIPWNWSLIRKWNWKELSKLASERRRKTTAESAKAIAITNHNNKSQDVKAGAVAVVAASATGIPPSANDDSVEMKEKQSQQLKQDVFAIHINQDNNHTAAINNNNNNNNPAQPQ